MAIQIPSGFIEICSYGIKSAADRYTKEGKILKSAFKIGPSDSVKSSGKILIDYSVSMSQDNTSTEDETSHQDSENTGKESYNYSMLEAFSRLNKIYEKDTDQTKSSVNVNKFEPGFEFYIQVLLPNEGCTVWRVQADRRARVESAKNAIKSKNFKAALEIAGKGIESDGLVPLSVKTYMSKNAKVNCPFVGHCRYAFDSGTEESSEESNTVCLAVAPINAVTNKPDEKTVFKAVYNIVGDISGGVINKLAAAVKSDSERNSDRDTIEQNVSDEVSEFLNQKFKCIGDSKMYDNFLKIRDFIDKQIKANNLEYNDADSESVIHYSKLSIFAGSEDGSKSFIYY